MLQKLLIAFVTLFLFSACGGSSSSEPDVQNPPPADTGGTNDNTGGPNDDTSGANDDTGGANDDTGGTNGDDSNTLVFDMGDSRWNNDGFESTLVYRDDDDVLVIIPDFSKVECPRSWDPDGRCLYIANHTVDGPLDLRGSRFAFELEISQSILDNGGEPGGIVLVAYAQESTDPWGGAWTCALNNQDIESTTLAYECTMPEDNDALNLAGGGDAGKVGLQILRGDIENSAGGVNNDIEGTITMKSFVIHLAGGTSDGTGGTNESVGGTWIFDGTGFFAILSFWPSLGEYLHVQEMENGEEGMEWGTYSLDENHVLSVIDSFFDENGSIGLTGGGSGEQATRFITDGNTLTLEVFHVLDPEETLEVFTARRAISEGLVGTWIWNKSATEVVALIFLADGTYILAGVQDRDEASNGAEIGRYSHDAATGIMTISDLRLDTNDDAGFSGFVNSTDELNISVSGNSLTLSVTENGEEGETIIFTRL